MHFGKYRKKSVKIGKERHIRKKNFGCLPRNAVCIPLAVVIMTTADGKHPAFSESHPKLFIISDIYRVVTEIVEMHGDIALSFLKCIRPLLP